MQRTLLQHLESWAAQSAHKPLVLRGARQVGKTHLVKQLGTQFPHFVNINLEKQTKVKALFAEDLDVKRIVNELSLLLDVTIIPGKTLLFFDEIQEAPQALTALRYFYEDLPELHVVAAGSLLDFAIEKVGIPVGRIQYLYLYPMSFQEFLLATHHENIVEYLLNHNFPKPMPEAIHVKCLNLVAEYCAIGGMPEVVSSWCETSDLAKSTQIKQALIEGYKQDFEKYAKKHQIKYLDLLFNQIPHQLGKPFKFSNISTDYRKRELAPCLDLLNKALVSRPIYHSDGQGVPLGAQTELQLFKMLYIDIALAQTMLGHLPKEWLLQKGQHFVNKGEIAEAFVGQELLAYSDPYMQAPLYYWQRQERSSNAEIDYLFEANGRIIPIEVKSSTGKTLKSMHLFLDSHAASPYGIRFSTLPFSQFEKIHSYPLYATMLLKKIRDS
jgi:hypothetical protein